MFQAASFIAAAPCVRDCSGILCERERGTGAGRGTGNGNGNWERGTGDGTGIGSGERGTGDGGRDGIWGAGRRWSEQRYSGKPDGLAGTHKKIER